VRHPPLHSIPDRDWIALVLAIGLCTALNLLCVGVVWDAVRSDTPGISENATQILTGWGGGVVGILGAMLGYKAGQTTEQGPPQDDDGQ
jgi:sulfite exporter TauE/SafE